MVRFLITMIMVLMPLVSSSHAAVSEDGLVVTVSVQPKLVRPGETVTITVVARNPTSFLIEFGAGSSSCQLAAAVRTGGADFRTTQARACLKDLRIWSLEPGERRIESWEWNGEIVVDREIQRLPAGAYELRGVAGRFAGPPTTLEIAE
jgi:hypothetical protein